MDKPTQTDYVSVICTRLSKFVQVEPQYERKLYTYGHQELIVFLIPR